MILLRGNAVDYNPAAPLLRVSSALNRPMALRSREACLVAGPEIPEGFACYLVKSAIAPALLPSLPADLATAVLPPAFDYLAEGDVVALEPEHRRLRTLFRKNARYNSFLLTERCNNNCLMCSQPPRNVQDGWIVDEILAALPLIDREAGEIGFTGGEPTLLGDRLIELIRATDSYLPWTSLHILSNGRSFVREELARDVAAVRHHDLMFGIPLYSDLPHLHDYVVQADGAFDETVRGILNLKKHGVRVEIRTVLQQQTIPRLAEFARFLARNLLFVDHVALMGLELMGFARANLETLWIDPADYQQELKAAVGILDRAGVHVSIYNSQLCVLDPSLHRFAVRSISDWKQEYMPDCDGCLLLDQCGGFFASAKHRYSRAIHPVLELVA
jgi:His-Xaa-Ser system radical SAM maturase HxsC